MIAAIHSALYYIACHWVGLTVAAFVLAIALTLEIWWILKKSPRDLTGNGIAIGQAKAFDSSSLTLRLQRLNAGLEALKVVNQNITENLSTVQERTSTASSSALSLKASPDSKDKDNKASDGKKDAENKTASDDKSSIGLGAGDALTNQLNLASQIFNLQTLYEGSLSDRMILNESRLQTVLGFQVSISPPVRYEDCVAIVEMSVRTRQVAAIAGNPAVAEEPVSLVALMPQEKTYNAEATTSVERSLDSAAAAKVFSLAATPKP
jgi:hypothetical protein